MARPLTMPQFAPVRCFFSEIQDRIAQNDGRGDIKFRLLGSIVGFSTAETLETTTTMTTTMTTMTTTAACGVLLAPPESPADDSRLVVRLDDGTALVEIIVTTKMATKLQLQEGSLVECIAAVVMKRRPAAGSDYPAPPSPAPPSSLAGAAIFDHSTFSLIGEQVAVITDANAETLRWMELCYRQEQDQEQQRRRRRQQQSGIGALVVDRDDDFTQEWLGYPTRRVAAEDLFRVIEYQCEFDDADGEEDNNKNNNGNHKKAPAPSSPKGVSAEQLKIAFNLTSEQVQTLLTALQVRWETYLPLNDIYRWEKAFPTFLTILKTEGLIYKNIQGLFCKL